VRKLKFISSLLGESVSRATSRKWQKEENFLPADFSDKLSSLSLTRVYILSLATFLVILIFFARLFGLTIVAGSENRELSENNRVQLTEQEALRGRIFDRRGELLSESRKTFQLRHGEEIVEITETQAKDLEANGLASENFEGPLGRVWRHVERDYVLGDAAAHVIGYTSVYQDGDVLGDSSRSHVQSVGRLGLEETYNDFLTGKVGKKLIEVDTFGKKVSILGNSDPQKGRDLYTTLDSDLQEVAYRALSLQVEKAGTQKGAVIVQDPATGEVLALASKPSFNPQDIGKSVSDLEKPFFNRAIQGVYPPGSVFKIVTALAGLESGKITKDTEIEDVGQFELGGAKFSNWFYLKYGKTDGIIKIQKAIARSNDTFFYKVAERLGLGSLREMAKKFGFGQKSGIDLPAEAVGLVPDEVWKRSAYQENWFLGDTMHLGIGQGFLLATPIQVNMMTSYMATGKLTKPYLVSKIEASSDDSINIQSKVIGENLVIGDNFLVVREGMRDVCKTGGTGAPFFNAPYEVGCKTGTAERELGNPHAWFTAFAPFDDPKISVTVLVEEGGEGSVVAAPAAREIVDWWMAHRNSK